MDARIVTSRRPAFILLLVLCTWSGSSSLHTDGQAGAKSPLVKVGNTHKLLSAENQQGHPAGVEINRGFPEGYAALCVIVKNQAADLREWLQHHRFIGVARVYLYDNNSTRPLSRRSIRDHIRSGFVQYSPLSSAHARSRIGFAGTPQGQAYNRCIQEHRHQHRWLGFLDADEFVILHNKQPLAAAALLNATDKQQPTPQQPQPQPQPSIIGALLSEYEGFGALALNWVMFGSNKHLHRPPGGVLVNYKKCLPLQSNVHTHVKVFANTAHVLAMGGSPHNVMFNSKGAYTVNELKQRVVGPFSSPPSHMRASVYHYVLKSKREYLQKMKRGAGDGTRKGKAFFFSTNAEATATCLAGLEAGLACCAKSLRRSIGEDGISQVQQTFEDLAASAVDLPATQTRA